LGITALNVLCFKRFPILEVSRIGRFRRSCSKDVMKSDSSVERRYPATSDIVAKIPYHLDHLPWPPFAINREVVRIEGIALVLIVVGTLFDPVFNPDER
jgi:hypothetical protein